MKLILLALATLALIAVPTSVAAQKPFVQPPTPKPNLRTPEIPLPPELPESVEHRILRLDRGRLSGQLAQFQRAFSQANSFDQTEIQNKITEIENTLDKRDRQLAYVDDCTAIYQKTIDMKQSDLTTRQADQVKACKALDLYPLGV
jgi:hypothetical protein